MKKQNGYCLETYNFHRENGKSVSTAMLLAEIMFKHLNGVK